MNPLKYRRDRRPMNFLATWVGPLLAAAGVLALPQAFIHSPWIMARFQDLLGWEVSPRLTGGPVLAKFLDPVDDDTGAGGLTYPLAEPFASHRVLDLVNYTVHRPLTDAAWADDREFWQLKLGFATLVPNAAGGCDGPMIRIYIDTDGTGGGSLNTLEPRAELVSFDPAHPWDLCISLDLPLGLAIVTGSDASWSRPVSVLTDSSTGGVILRLPLDHPQLAAVLDGRATWHYVVTGAWDPYSSGHFMAIKSSPGLSAGGGSLSTGTPRIFDCLVPPGHRQSEVLAVAPDSDQPDATLIPVSVPAWNPWAVPQPNSTMPANTQVGANRLADLARQADLDAKKALEADQSLASRLLSSADSWDKPVETGIALFNAGRSNEADRYFQAVAPDGWRPEADSMARPAFSVSAADQLVAWAYRGAIRAQAGGADGISVGDAIRLVNEGYAMMDTSADLVMGIIKSDNNNVSNKIAGLTNDHICRILAVRAHVSLAVPEEVFQKSTQGAADFTTIAGVIVPPGTDPTTISPADREWAAACWRDAGLCLERTGPQNGATLMFQRAQALGPTKADTLLDLERRGITQDR